MARHHRPDLHILANIIGEEIHDAMDLHDYLGSSIVMVTMLKGGDPSYAEERMFNRILVDNPGVDWERIASRYQRECGPRGKRWSQQNVFISRTEVKYFATLYFCTMQNHLWVLLLLDYWSLHAGRCQCRKCNAVLPPWTTKDAWSMVRYDDPRLQPLSINCSFGQAKRLREKETKEFLQKNKKIRSNPTRISP